MPTDVCIFAFIQRDKKWAPKRFYSICFIGRVNKHQVFDLLYSVDNIKGVYVRLKRQLKSIHGCVELVFVLAGVRLLNVVVRKTRFVRTGDVFLCSYRVSRVDEYFY